MNRHRRLGAMFVALFLALGTGSFVLDRVARVKAASVMAPRFEVDPMWPKPLPNHWILGNAIGVGVDSNDHIWIVHRQASLEAMENYAAANPPGPKRREGVQVGLRLEQLGDALGVEAQVGEDLRVGAEEDGGAAAARGAGAGAGRAGAGRGTPAPEGQPTPGYFNDNMILKFTQSGKFLMQIGRPGQSKGSNDVENLKGAAKMYVDPKTDELYVADGYGNHRVIVFDAETGKYKRHWGAYGHKPDDTPLGRYDPAEAPAQQFRNPVHCAELSHDGLLYVCDRPNDRIQVFKPDGTFVKEVFIAKNTLGDGSVWDIAFSKDPQQKYIYLADGSNEKVYIIARESMEILTSFGDGGRQPGEFYAVHSIATDSKGNIFTTETYRGQRIQKFLYKGMAAVTKKDQGVVWPKSLKN